MKEFIQSILYTILFLIVAPLAVYLILGFCSFLINDPLHIINFPN